MNIELVRIKEIQPVTRVGIPIDEDLKVFCEQFDKAHREVFGRAASKQQVLYLLIEHGKEKVEKMLHWMELELTNQD